MHGAFLLTVGLLFAIIGLDLWAHSALRRALNRMSSEKHI